MSNIYSDEITDITNVIVDDLYEGSGINDRTLGRMYVLKKYAAACDDQYNKLRKEVEVPTDLPEKQVIKNDSRYSAVAVPRKGSEKIDRALMSSELAKLIMTAAPLSLTQATINADRIIDRCTIVGKDTVAVTIIEDRR